MAAPGEKIGSIQLLRGLAAGTVAILHIAFAYADHLTPGLGLPDIGGLGQSAVALFFIVSGYVMVISTRSLAGSSHATRVFWTRRCIRILPPYWLATAFTVAVMLYLGRAVDGERLAASLALFPTATADFQGRPEFLLWPGWTLFYEMVFYFLFGLGLRWGRLQASAIAVGAILALVLAGQVLEPRNAFVVAATRPVMLIFIAGIALAMLRERGMQLWPAARWACLVLSIVAYAMLEQPVQAGSLDFNYTAWAGFPALLMGMAVLGGPLRLPGKRLVNLMGDASYSLYLLHVPLAMLAISFAPMRYGGAWPFLLVTTGIVFVASLLTFMLVERPLTQFLRGLLAVTADAKDQLDPSRAPSA